MDENEKRGDKSLNARLFLQAWSGQGISAVAKPYNSHEILSVYSQATGISFAESLMKAAQALLDQWRKENAENVSSNETDAEQTSLYEDEDLRALLRDKVQFNIGNLPRFIAEIYEAQCQSEDMNKREYFYHLLREQGGLIPPYVKMDGRKL